MFGVVFLLFCYVLVVKCFTHFSLDNEGTIQSKADSIYHLRNPGDLLTFLAQEERETQLLKLYHEIIDRENEIQKNLTQWSSQSVSQLESYLYSTDPDCIIAQTPLNEKDFFAFVVDYGVSDLSPEELQLIQSSTAQEFDLDCDKLFSLDFSMSIFPHLKVLSMPWDINWVKEEQIHLPLTPSQIFSGLLKNNTSWYLYNLASLYWRKVGNSQKALDCTKRAIYFASRDTKDTPMINMGVMLLRALCPAESAILLHSAIDHSPYKSIAHFALGNTYAFLEDYERSVTCYNNALELRPNFKDAKRMKYAVICHSKFKQVLAQVRKSLEDILQQLQVYRGRLKTLLSTQETILSFKERTSFIFSNDVGLNQKQGTYCVRDSETETGSLNCISTGINLSPSLMFSNDVTLSVETLLKNVDNKSKQVSSLFRSSQREQW